MRLYVGLNSRLINNPSIYCKLHKIYLTGKDIKFKQCNEKQCIHVVTKCNWGKEGLK